jgi:hypothetical protein
MNHTAESDAVSKGLADIINVPAKGLVVNEPILNEPAIVNLLAETKDITNKPVLTHCQ